MHGHAGADDCYVVVFRRPDHAAAADTELLVGVVDHRRVGSQGTQEGDPFGVSHRGDELRRLVRVARVEHDARVDGAERRDVLERHLRRPVLADRHPGM